MVSTRSSTASSSGEPKGVKKTPRLEQSKAVKKTPRPQQSKGVKNGARSSSGSVTNSSFKSHVDESYFGGERGFYTGQVDVQGRRHGRGLMRYECGDEYEGEWVRDYCEGRGVKHFENGDVYEGEWKASRFHGSGKCSYPSRGLVYEGGFADGRYAGHGVMTRHGELEAEGDWSSWTWTEGEWYAPYPQEGGRGVRVTARKSTGGPAPRKPLGCS